METLEEFYESLGEDAKMMISDYLDDVVEHTGCMVCRFEMFNKIIRDAYQTFYKVEKFNEELSEGN